MTDKTDSKERETLMKLADVYADTSFEQGLHKRRYDDKPEEAREELEKALNASLAGHASMQSPGFTAADMATASAQGFRDGVASLAASAGREPVATVFTMEALAPGGGVKYHATVHKPLPAGTKLYLHPSPPEGMVMVPKEPTEAMLEAVDEEVGGHCYSCSKWRASYDDCRRIWAAMIAAAPPTTSAGSKGE